MGKGVKHFGMIIQEAIVSLVVAFSFVLIPVEVGIIFYYQFINYQPVGVVTSCVVLYLMIHTNKNVRGR